MASQDMNPDLPLDVHLNGIREKFDRLCQELEEARIQRDAYMRDCIVGYIFVCESLIRP